MCATVSLGVGCEVVEGASLRSGTVPWLDLVFSLPAVATLPPFLVIGKCRAVALEVPVLPAVVADSMVDVTC